MAASSGSSAHPGRTVNGTGYRRSKWGRGYADPEERKQYYQGDAREQYLAARRRGGALSPEEEQEYRRAGKAVPLYHDRQEVPLEKATVKAFMDYLWWHQGEGWVPAIDVPSRIRLKQRQIQDMDEDLNPYKGYRVIVAQARAGWKARVDTERKYMEFQLTKAGQSKNKEVLRREQLAGPRTDQQYLDNVAIKRKRAQARASSCELAPAGTQEIKEQLDAMWNEQSPSEMEEGPLQAPGTLARQLRGSAERMAANPLLCKEEGDEAQDVVTMSAAATRWNLFCGFAGQHLNKALSAELGDRVDAVCSTLSVQHLDEAKKLLQEVRWGQNTLPPDELAKDARVATEFSQSLSERAQRCEAQC